MFSNVNVGLGTTYEVLVYNFWLKWSTLAWSRPCTQSISSRLISPTRFTPALQKQGRPKLEAKLKMKAKIQAIKEARKAERANTSILTMAQIPRSWLVIEISIGNGRQQLVLHIPISQDPPHTWACCSKLRAAGLHGLFTKNSWTKIPPGSGL